jgi:predicted DNA-binding transcriptional regulator YafY
VDDSWYEAIIKDQSYSRGLAMWILMLGENAYVVSPTHIREDIKRELDKTLMYYKKGVF